jgi:methylated-DNA-[protein]-cysteine S-methyltransferase
MNDTEKTYWTGFESPVGELFVAGDEKAVSALYMEGHRGRPPIEAERDDDRLAFATAQLREFFAGEREEFDIPLAPRGGTEFHRAVWRQLLEIPFGQTRTYGEIARRLGDPTAARAVGVANARNPISIIVPCHRVIGANGKLVGYGGGLPRKEWLLNFESGFPAFALTG